MRIRFIRLFITCCWRRLSRFFRGLPGGFDWHLARLVSLALCLGALILLRQIALVAGADRPKSAGAFALFVTVGVGLLPIFGMTAGTINNDSAMLFTVTWFLWLLAVKYPRDESFKAAIILGLVFGLGGGSKATALLCNGVALIAYLWAQNGTRGLFKPRTLARGATVIGVAVAVCGWWYIRNQLLYGRLTPIAQGYSPADLGYIPAVSQGMLVQIMHPNFPGLVGQALSGIFDSMWSQIDWIPPALRAPIYWSLLVFTALGLLGLLRAKRAVSEAEEAQSLARRIALWSGGAALATNAAACLFFALFVHWGWYQGGRYLLASLGGLMLLLAWGWRSILGEKLFNLAPVVFGFCSVGIERFNARSSDDRSQPNRARGHPGGDAISDFKDQIWVVIPTLNEAGTIDTVVRDCLLYGQVVLVIDGGSTDGTAELARVAERARRGVFGAGQGPRVATRARIGRGAGHGFLSTPTARIRRAIFRVWPRRSSRAMPRWSWVAVGRAARTNCTAT